MREEPFVSVRLSRAVYLMAFRKRDPVSRLIPEWQSTVMRRVLCKRELFFWGSQLDSICCRQVERLSLAPLVVRRWGFPNAPAVAFCLVEEVSIQIVSGVTTGSGLRQFF